MFLNAHAKLESVREIFLSKDLVNLPGFHFVCLIADKHLAQAKMVHTSSEYSKRKCRRINIHAVLDLCFIGNKLVLSLNKICFLFYLFVILTAFSI